MISLHRAVRRPQAANIIALITRCSSNVTAEEVTAKPKHEPSLRDFMVTKTPGTSTAGNNTVAGNNATGSRDSNRDSNRDIKEDLSLTPIMKTSMPLLFHVETYGCQMNLSDTEIVRSILLKAGHTETAVLADAELIFQNTCAIRENAETKIWNRLREFGSMRRKSKRKGYPKIGVLGCMAERLKERLLDDRAVDLVCGPDAYRDLPRLLEAVVSTDQKEANTQLSFEETYADISPVRKAGSESAFVSIMRGCNNMCSFCVVPFTRGRERSRDMSSILAEIEQLVREEGVREIVLLGQNVNGFHDTSAHSALLYPLSEYKASSSGFTNLFQSRNRQLPGARFSDLLVSVASISPDLRVRFTSPHPKDFPEDVLAAVSSYPNICASLHLPVQSGSNSVLQRMRRGYTREAYLALVASARSMIPNLKISTDIIAGFCGETEKEHQDSLRLMEEVRFDQAFMFAYSLREKTHAARVMEDDVPEAVKNRRLQEIIATFRSNVVARNLETETGGLRLVLVEGLSSKATAGRQTLTGRTDGNQRVVFDVASVATPGVSEGASEESEGAVFVIEEFDCEGTEWDDREMTREEAEERLRVSARRYAVRVGSGREGQCEGQGEWVAQGETKGEVQGQQGEGEGRGLGLAECTSSNHFKGQYVVVKVIEAQSTTLRGVAVGRCSIQAFHERETRYAREAADVVSGGGAGSPHVSADIENIGHKGDVGGISGMGDISSGSSVDCR